jgi:hypothetical protein
VDFGELNDKAIKGLMYLSKIVSRFYLYIHECHTRPKLDGP